MDVKRYSRQIILSGFGVEAQDKLFNSRVLVVGAGGLGCPVLQYLTSAGIGQVGIVDFDQVEVTNLHRQILFKEGDVGKFKSIAAKERLEEMNSEVKIVSFTEKITADNVSKIIDSYEIIVDCTDNFQIRYLLNDICTIKNLPLIYGAIYQYEGQISVFNVEKEEMRTNYRDLFPNPPSPSEVPTCNQTGVLGTLTGIIGTIQAQEVIKIITGIGEPLVHKLMIFNILDYTTRIINFTKSEKNFTPKNEDEIKAIDYEHICGVFTSVNEIENLSRLKEVLSQKKSILVDVRNENELPKISGFDYKQIPLSVFKENIHILEEYDSIVFVCKTGLRSSRAVEIAEGKFPEKEIWHIRNGIETIF
ncbi:adenylyltransferase and sulfurtransferase [Apibacter mensalis]|uniref:Molybdopterin-synthase adenylyltransferase n=1 Tax=Apibacter mensalis TaxID=1586267 RepID=A0A0X3APK8_9FLAO|nr:HesA/MoeB/ThiF family protein [Apibacter mensalis]CVK17069.1 adenylyltransferase and sulfurtransferase [Apibacter mensalis]